MSLGPLSRLRPVGLSRKRFKRTAKGCGLGCRDGPAGLGANLRLASADRSAHPTPFPTSDFKKRVKGPKLRPLSAAVSPTTAFTCSRTAGAMAVTAKPPGRGNQGHTKGLISGGCSPAILSLPVPEERRRYIRKRKVIADRE